MNKIFFYFNQNSKISILLKPILHQCNHCPETEHTILGIKTIWIPTKLLTTTFIRPKSRFRYTVLYFIHISIMPSRHLLLIKFSHYTCNHPNLGTRAHENDNTYSNFTSAPLRTQVQKATQPSPPVETRTPSLSGAGQNCKAVIIPVWLLKTAI